MYDNHFSNFGRPPLRDDLRKDSAPRLEKKIFKGFYHIWAWQPSWSMEGDILAIFCSPNLRRLHMNLSKIGSAGSEEKSFENVNGWTHGRWKKVITIAQVS